MTATAKLKITLLAVFCTLTNLSVNSQSLYTNQIVVPPSPAVASFQQFDFSEVNLYNGLPVINIPVCELEFGSLKYPISLNYSYNGFKVEDVAGWLGLGWDITATGMISHIVRGKLDEDSFFGYYRVRELVGIPDPINDATAYSYFTSNLSNDNKRRFANGVYDGIPDTYEIKANNISGSIIKLNSGEYVTVPFKKYKITKNGDLWQITDESGNLYRFGRLGEGSDNYGLEYTGYEYCDGDLSHEDQKSYISNWFLREIVTNTNDTIRFNYVSETIERTPLINQTSFRKLPNINGCYPITDYLGVTTFWPTVTWRLSSIESRKCSVRFYSHTPRKDVMTGSNSTCLDSINIKDSFGKTVKTLVFGYDYLGNSNDNDRCRLILKSITEFGSNSVSYPPHLFDYEENGSVPSYTSKGQDFLGFYNGKYNETLVPSFVHNSEYNDYFNNCADRSPDHLYSKPGLLTKITLPTQGTISYIYEPHDYGYVRNRRNPAVPLSVGAGAAASVVGVSKEYITDSRAFTVYDDQTIDISYSLKDNGYPNEEDNEVVISRNDSIVFFKFGFNSEGSDKLFLSSGQYIISARSFGRGLSASISVTYKRYITDDEGNILYNKDLTAGGSRIKKSVQFDGIDHKNDRILTYSYRMADEPDRSSGVLNHAPSYDFITKIPEIIYLGGALNIPASPYDCAYISRASSSVQPTYGSDGHIGYAYIQVRDGENNENGSTLYNYSTSRQYPDITFPKVSQPISRHYLRGRLQKISIIDNLNNVLYTKEQRYNMPSSSPNRSGIAGVFLLEYEHDDPQDYLDRFNVPYFGIIASEWSYLTESIETHYTGNNIVSDTTMYFYENPVHAQLTRISRTGSDGKLVETRLSYPSDNPSNIQTSPQVINSLIQNNMQFRLKEEKSVQQTVGDGQIVNYGSNLLPSDSYILDNGVYKPDIIFDTYDNAGNLLQYHKDNDFFSSCIWGYNNSYQVVQADNIRYSDLVNAVNAAAGGSFENLLSQVRDMNTESQKNAWKNFNISLRTNPLILKSLVTTYTYKPLVGMTSRTDSNGLTTYYEYDSTGRLICIKDNDSKILRHIEYHHAR